ncbi:MAG: (d)CMP kinase [Nitrospinaceae bacterium]
MIIAIDGPAGSGKSTVAKFLARRLNFRYIETGSMYRAVAWESARMGIDLNDRERVAAVAGSLDIAFAPGDGGQRVLVGGRDLTEQLQTEQVGRQAATVAANPEVRGILVPKQRAMGRQGDVVLDGRDIGTVVFPDADRKFYLDADAEERARRRFEQIKASHPGLTQEEVLQQVRQRDHEDKNRAASPLRRAAGAIALDTTSKSVEDVVEEMMKIIEDPSHN